MTAFTKKGKRPGIDSLLVRGIPSVGSPPVGVVGPQSYTFGTHADAFYNAEALKGTQIRKSLVAGATPVIGDYQYAPQQSYQDVQTQGTVTLKSLVAGATPVIGDYQYAAPQVYQDLQAQLFKALFTQPAVVSGVLGARQYAPEQAIDPTLSPTYAPLSSVVVAGSTPVIGDYQYAAQQSYQDLQAQLLKAVFTPSVSGILGVRQYAPEQAIDFNVRQSYTPTASLPQGFVVPLQDAESQDYVDVQPQYSRPSTVVTITTGVLGTYTVVLEQAAERNLQAIYSAPAHGPQGPVPPYIAIAEQAIDRTPLPQFTIARPAVLIINGVTVRPSTPTPPQYDLNVNYSVRFTPSTFSPSGPVKELHQVNLSATFGIGLNWMGTKK